MGQTSFDALKNNAISVLSHKFLLLKRGRVRMSGEIDSCATCEAALMRYITMELYFTGRLLVAGAKNSVVFFLQGIN